jgi:hypothetical protein
VWLTPGLPLDPWSFGAPVWRPPLGQSLPRLLLGRPSGYQEPQIRSSLKPCLLGIPQLPSNEERYSSATAAGVHQAVFEAARHQEHDPLQGSEGNELVNGLPRGQVVGHVAPGGASAYDPTQPVEDRAQVVGALGGILADQR